MSEREFAVSTSLSIDDVKSGLQELVNLFRDVPKDIETDIKIDADKSIIDDVKKDLEDLQGYKANAEIEIDDSEASNVINDIKSELDVINGDTVQATISAEDDASSVVDAITNKLDEMEGITTVVLTGEDDASEVIEQVKSELDSLPTSVEIEINADDSGVSEATGTTNDLTGAVTDVVGGLGLYKFGMEGLTFENYIGQAQAYTNATAEQRAQMEQVVKSNSSAKYQVNALSDAYKYLAIQTGNADTANELFNTELSYIKQNSADLTGGITGLTKLYQMYGLNSDQAANATATLNGEILKSGYSGDQFLTLVQRSSMDLKNMGFTLEDTGAIVSSFGRSGIDSTQAMRMLRGGFSEFIKEFDTGNPKLGEYEDKIHAAGVATRDAQGNLRPAKDVLSDLMEAFARLPEGPEKTQLAMELFGTSAGKVMGNLKVNYKDVEREAQTSAQGQIKAAKKVRTETQDPLLWLQNELTKLTTGWGNTASQIVSYAGLLITGYGAWKLAGQRILSAILPDDAKVKIDRYFTEIKTNINEKLVELRTKVFGGDKAKFEIKITEDEKGNVIVEEAKINGFIERVKLKINELKNTNIWRMLFGDEKGQVSVEEPLNKITSFINRTKAKIDELRNYNIWDRLSGADNGASRASASESNAGGMIDRLKTKIDELKNYNIYDRITGGKTGEIEPPKGTDTSGSWAEKVKGWVKGINLDSVKGVGVRILSDPELLPMIIGTYFGEQNLERIKTEYEKWKQGQPADISPDEIKQMQQAEKVQEWQEKQPKNKYTEDTYGFDDLKKDIEGFFGWLGSQKFPSIWDIIFPKPASASGGGNDHLTMVQDIQNEIQKFWDWYNKLNWPNFLDLIFGKKKEGEKDKEDPIAKFTTETKEKINKFFEWLGTLNPISLLDILMGKKPGEKQEGDKDPITQFINQTKEKVNKFFEYLGTLNPLSIVDILMGRKPGQKKEEDPLSQFIAQAKEKINGFFEFLGTLNPLSLIDLILGRKPGEKKGEDPLAQFIAQSKEKINGFLEWFGTLNPINIVDKIIGRKPGEEDPLAKWIEETKQRINQFIEDVKSTAQKWYDTGKQLITNFVKGMKDAYNDLPPVLQKIADSLFRSPAKEGPLAEITETGFFDYGRAVIRAFSSGIYNELKQSLLPVLEEGSWMIGQFNMITKGYGTLDLTGMNNTEYNRPTALPGTSGGSDWSKWNPLKIDWTKPMAEAIDFTKSFGNLFPASPPKEGPLSKITAGGASGWMHGIVSGMASGAKSGMGELNSALGGVGQSVLNSGGTSLQGSAASLNSSAATLNKAGQAILKSAAGGNAGQPTLNVTVQPGAVVMGGSKDNAGKPELRTTRNVHSAGSVLARSITDSLKNNGIKIERW